MTTSTTGSPLSAPAASPASLHLAVIGAGPVGLALALHAARRLPQARICVHDRLPASHDVTADPRTLALSQGSVVELRRLGVWDAMAEQAEPIRCVHVSQQQPGLMELLGRGAAPALRIRAEVCASTRRDAVSSRSASGRRARCSASRPVGGRSGPMPGKRPRRRSSKPGSSAPLFKVSGASQRKRCGVTIPTEFSEVISVCSHKKQNPVG